MVGRMQQAMTDLIAEFLAVPCRRTSRFDTPGGGCHPGVNRRERDRRGQQNARGLPASLSIGSGAVCGLQSDPTVVYALTERVAGPLGRRLTRSDLATWSRHFNTYRVARTAAPRPIANPGTGRPWPRCCNPADTDDLYFVRRW